MRPARQRFPFDAAFTAICKKEKVSQKAAAKRLGIGPSHLSDILAGRKRLSPAHALRFEEEFGLDAQTLLEWQAAEDLARARRGNKKE